MNEVNISSYIFHMLTAFQKTDVNILNGVSWIPRISCQI